MRRVAGASWVLEAGAYQHVDGAAHAVLGTLVVGDGAVGQQVLQLAAEEQSQLLSGLRQVSVAPAVLQQSADKDTINQTTSQKKKRRGGAAAGIIGLPFRFLSLQP